jgi:hypothetical protein
MGRWHTPDSKAQTDERTLLANRKDPLVLTKKLSSPRVLTSAPGKHINPPVRQTRPITLAEVWKKKDDNPLT